jgi:hypothetical protein
MKRAVASVLKVEPDIVENLPFVGAQVDPAGDCGQEA